MGKIFVSHSSKDSEIAKKIAIALHAEFGKDKVFIDLFDLDAGANLVSTISSAISEANWFILVASESALNSSWVKFEATYGTIRHIESENFNFLTIRIDDYSFPSELDFLRTFKFLDLKIFGTIDTLIDQVIVTIRSNPQHLQQLHGRRFIEPFVGRGTEQDSIEVAVASHKVVLLLGVSGIGKAALVNKMASSRFARDLLTIELRPSHDSELLSRNIIDLTGNPQPDNNADEDYLLTTAIYLIVNRINDGNGMLFLNNAHHAIDSDGRFQPFLARFIEQYVESSASFPIFLASTRLTDYRPNQITYTLPIMVSPLQPNQMSIAIQQWHKLMYPDAPSFSKDELMPLVKKLGGYPLAAKLIAGFLLFQGIRTLLTDANKLGGFQQNIAEFILANIELDELDRHILYAMAIYQIAMPVRYMLAVSPIKKKGKEEVHRSLDKLSRTMLIQQNLDSYKLHEFVADYFGDEALRHKLYDLFAKDLASIALADTHTTLRKLENIPKRERNHENLDYLRLNRELMQSVVPTHRLLRVTKQASKLGDIPYRLKGHLREMVFVMYDKAEDYSACVEFAEEWLKVEPDDDQVRLYLARAFRRLERYAEADSVLEVLEIEATKSGPMLSSQIYRERSIMAFQQNDYNTAIDLCRKGLFRKRDGTPRYAQIFVDYARALIAKANLLWEGDPEQLSLLDEAVKALEDARPHVARFETYSMGMYVQALVQTKRINALEAAQMLEDTLHFQLHDKGATYLQIAKVLLHEQPTTALNYAISAVQANVRGAILTLVEIYINLKQYDKAISEIQNFQPSLERDRLVAKVLHARALTGKGETDKARNMLKLLESNPYVVRAMLENEVAAAEHASYSQQDEKAKYYIAEASKIFQGEHLSSSQNQFLNRINERIDKLKQKPK